MNKEIYTNFQLFDENDTVIENIKEKLCKQIIVSKKYTLKLSNIRFF